VNSKRRFGFVAGIGLAMAGSIGAHAQGVITPGRVLESVRPDTKPALPAVGEAPVITSNQPSAAQLDPNAPRFQVKQFNLTGNTAFDSATLHALIDAYAGKSYNLYELQDILKIITDHYRRAGYPVARAVLPAQKVENNLLAIEVIEGRVDRTVFSGNRGYGSELLGRWGQPLVGRNVQMDALEERLLLINDLPGMEARAVLRPGETYGTTTTEISVKEDPVDGRVSINNYGRSEVGENRIDAAVQFNNPLGIGDQLGLQSSVSEDTLLKLYGISYSLPIGVRGTRVNASYTHVDYDVGGELEDLDLSGKSNLASIGISQPLLRSRRENLYGTVTIRSFSGEQFFSGTSLSDSDVVLIETGLAWNCVHASNNVSSAGLRVSTNLRDSDHGTRDNAHLFKIDGEFQHLLRLSERWEMKLETSAMYSPDTLVDAERFSIGGPTSVRGYPAAWSLGDRGVFASVEGRYHFTAVAVPTMFSLFSDAGYVKQKYAAVGTTAAANLSSVGMGLSFAPKSWLSAEVAAALPTGDMKSADGHESGRLWFSLAGTF
jgi:hemolysin activation/secretion protein